ncbi:MAG TPA: Do family serine endopeptidase, partial [Thiolinea sp.]|nr:Do family serine endopeptidase [Thiolinea sp.]
MTNLLPVGLFKKKKLSVLAASALVCALAFPLTAPLAHADALPQLTQLIKDNRDAVVHVSVEIDNKAAGNAEAETFALPDGQGLPKDLEKFFRSLPRGGATPQPREAQAMGSGFIISQDGYIVTNNHVVENATSIKVTLNDKRELTAKVVGKDKYSDIALLKIEATGLPVVRLGDSDGLEVGQWVVAIGAPFGLDHSATQGIVSALSRSLPDGTYVPFIQTDVAVNPGNSGGPLFDLNGNVVGVNSQIYSRSGGYMGISFAIPVNLVKNITEQLKTAGVVSRGWLGVQIQNMDQELANSFSMSKPQGALVASVQPSSPADKAGVQAGDIIVGFNNMDVNSADHLPLLVGTTNIGSTVPLKVLRSGAEKTLNVTIEKLTDKDAGEPQAVAQNSTTGTGALGLA